MTGQQTPARRRFLRLRDAVGLPPGGEVVHRHEVEQIADHFGIEDDGYTKQRLVFEVLRFAKSHYYGYATRTWDEASDGCRDYTYIQSSEADILAEVAEEINEFEWTTDT